MVPEVVEEHAQRAAFAVAQRARLARGRHGDAAQLAAFDATLQAHLDGLRAGGRTAERAIARLPAGPGASFLRTWWNPEAVAPPARDPLALAWRGQAEVVNLPPAAAAQLAAWSGHPLGAEAARRGLADDEARVATLQLLGARRVEVAEGERAELLRAARDGEVRAMRLEGARWLALTEDLGALETLIELAGGTDAVAEEAAASLALASPTLGRTWLLAQGERRGRPVAAALEMLGDVELLEALLPWLDEPPWARLAASVLATVGGFAMVGDRVAGRPRGFTEGPSFDPDDDDVRVPVDALLPWPAPKAVRAAWRDATAGGGPLLGGLPRDDEGWAWAVSHGCQPVRQRAVDRGPPRAWFDVTRPTVTPG